jgi:molybdate transport system substrate-binding protein
MRIAVRGFVSSVIVLIFMLLAFVGCQHSGKKKQQVKTYSPSKPLVFIYCENGVAPLLAALKEPFEKNYNCRIRLINDCASNLVQLQNYTQRADLFMPDAGSSLSAYRFGSNVTVIDSVLLGQNQLVLLVRKNNPKKIKGTIKSLVEGNYAIAIANPETGSLGSETNRMLVESKYLSKLSKNIVAMSVDSRGLDRLVETGVVDCAITWVTALGSVNSEAVEPVALDDNYDTPIYLGLMSSSLNQNIAKYFMDFVTSAEQSEILQQYGIKSRRVQVF